MWLQVSTCRSHYKEPNLSVYKRTFQLALLGILLNYYNQCMDMNTVRLSENYLAHAWNRTPDPVASTLCRPQHAHCARRQSSETNELCCMVENSTRSFAACQTNRIVSSRVQNKNNLLDRGFRSLSCIRKSNFILAGQNLLLASPLLSNTSVYG